MFRRGYLGQSSRGTKRIGTPKLWKFMKKMSLFDDILIFNFCILNNSIKDAWMFTSLFRQKNPETRKPTPQHKNPWPRIKT